MDPLVWTTIAEFWWIGPTVIGAGALGWLGVRHQRAENARRLEYDAARHELRDARKTASAGRVAVRVARADLARAQAERTASRATSADVAAARRELQRAQREANAASAAVRSRRARVSAARVALPRSAADPTALPLSRLMAAHDAVTARWLEYETDPAKLIAFPTMSDGRQPQTAAYLAQRTATQRLRPASPQARMTPEAFAAYRDAVHGLTRAFETAEAEAWRQARASGTAPPAPEPEPAALRWATVAQSVAQTFLTTSADAISRAAASVRVPSDEPPHEREPGAGARPEPEPPHEPTAQTPEAAAPKAAAKPSSGPPRVWPVPARTDRRGER